MIVVRDGLRLDILEKLCVSHSEIGLQTSISLSLILNILMKRSHLRLVLVSVGVSLCLGLVDNDIHSVSGISDSSLQLNADVILLCEGGVDLIVLYSGVLNSVFKLSWQVHT